MRQIFCFILFLLLTTFAFSQTETTKGAEYSSAEPQWNIDKYLWSYAQCKNEKNGKPLLDFNAIDNWQLMGNYLAINNNGSYFAYTVERGGAYANKYLDSLVVQSTSNPWRYSFKDASPGFFAGNNKQYVFQKKDALYFLELRTGKFKVISDIKSYKTAQAANNWLAYQLKNDTVILLNLITRKEKYFPNASTYSFENSQQWFVSVTVNTTKELLIYNLVSGTERRFSSLNSYVFASDGNALLLQKKNELEYVNLELQTTTTVWTTKDDSKTISALQFDASGEQVVFTVQDNSKESEGNSIWYYRAGMDKAIVKVDNKTNCIQNNLQIKSSAGFTDNDHYIQFSLEKKKESKNLQADAVQLEVWNYKDRQLQSNQAYLLAHSKTYAAIVNLDNGLVLPIEHDERKLAILHGDFALMNKNNNETHGDRFWETDGSLSQDSNWVVSLRDGSSYLLPTKGRTGTLWFSPGGNYLVYFDPVNHHYHSYHLYTKALADLTPNVSENQLNFLDAFLSIPPTSTNSPAGIAAWLPGDKGLLVYDNNDIWKLDLTGQKQAVNITNGLGAANDIIFSLMSSERLSYRAKETVTENHTLLLRAYNTSNRYTGFYQTAFKEKVNPKLLYMGPYFTQLIDWIQDPNLSNKGKVPLRARDVNMWIVQRESVSDAPNYFITLDFKTFKRLTNFEPQKNLNWLSEELHSFAHLDDKTGQGILYKPEDFDPSKKYPVLIVFYGKYSNNLYQFPVPAYNYTAITPGESPSWFLSNGYLVFSPDIYVSPLKYGPEAFNVIEGAAEYLKTLSYVDGDKIGCVSHSWSAKLGAYIFTHSKSIRATSISEGALFGNMINVALSTNENGSSKLNEVERGFQFGNLWDNKDLWLDQTTVLNVDRAISPLLLYCSKEDPREDEYPNQTLQIFTALRRLEKKVWWLHYVKGEHTIGDLNEQKDYTIRYTQFFDHYLKSAPAPTWMTNGIPYKLRGIESRYELDPSGSCDLPNKKECKICKKWNEQYKKHPEMFSKPINEWHLDKDIEKKLK